MEHPQQLSQKEAKEKILSILLNEGYVKPSYHYNEDRKNLRNAPLEDVLYVLETGEIKSNPDWDEKHQNWVCKVEGYDFENDKLIVVTAIVEVNWRLVIITVTG
jgi:Domain of unknown function (DUF4258)